MDEVNQGLMTAYLNAPWDPMAPWHKAGPRPDARHSPALGGGRRMRHPFLDPIVYPRVPDRTTGFGYDRLTRVHSVVIKTLSSSAVAKYQDEDEDVVIREIWQAGTLSTLTSLFHHFRRYLVTMLPPGRYLGWQPRDLSPKSFFIELLNVECGPPDEYQIEELGDDRPYYMREQLTVSFKLMKEISSPAGVITMTGL